MDKHILVTVSADKSASSGIRFLAEFFKNKSGMELTLYYTVAWPESVKGGMPGYQEICEMEQMGKQREKIARAALGRARDKLRMLGFDRATINEKIHFRRTSAALDILHEGEKGLYDAVVLGRRGLNWIEELVESSVSKELLSKPVTIPIWVCRDPAGGRRNVLACVDDSAQALRMVDHVTYILAGEDHAITLLNIFDPHSGDRIFAEELFATCKGIALENGFPAERLHTRVIEDYNVAKAILRAASQGEYAVVATGRTGEDRGLLHRIFMGSVSTALYRQLTGAVLWLSM
ncbi:MAG: universal stress protein [Desulfovibrionaceae bacterium]